MPYCSNCGRNLEDSDNFCEDCGKKRSGKTVEKEDSKAPINESDTKLIKKDTETRLTTKENNDKAITKPITSRMHQLRSGIFTIQMFSASLESIIIFLFCAIVLSLKGYSTSFGIVPAFAYFINELTRELAGKSTTNRVLIKYPDLKERLQTARDNEENPNATAQQLIAEVSKKLDEMHLSEFINTRSILSRVSIIILLLFFFLFMHLTGIQQTAKNYLTDISIALGIVLLCSLYTIFFLIKNPNPREKQDPPKDKSVDNTKLFCSKCDRPILDTYVYCRYCGSKLRINSVYEKETQKGDYEAMAIYRNSRLFYRCSKLFQGNNSARIERKRLHIK